MRLIRSLSVTAPLVLPMLALGALGTGCLVESVVGYSDLGSGGAGGSGSSGTGSASTGVIEIGVGGAGGSGSSGGSGGGTATTGVGGSGGSGSSGSSGGSGGSGGGTTTSGAGGAGGGAGPELLYSVGFEINPWAIAVDADTVYITDAQGPDGKVISVPKSGGPHTVLAAGLYLPSPLAVDATDVYFLTSDALLKVPVAGGVPSVVAPATNASYSAVALDDDNVYWTNYDAPGSAQQTPKAGGAVVTVDADEYAAGLVLADDKMCWASFGQNAIKCAPTAGGPAAVFAANQNAPRWGIAADSTHLYWMTEGDFPMQLWSGALDGSTPPAQIGESPTDASYATTMVVDSTYVYFVVPYCEIARIPIGGGPALSTIVDPAVGCPRFMTADADNLYYTSEIGVTKYPKSAL